MHVTVTRMALLLSCWLVLGTPPAASQGPPLSNDRMQLVELQVWLTRAHASPGPIDGLNGKNTELAIRAYQRMSKLEETGAITAALRERLSASMEQPVLVDYEVQQEDVAGPFLDAVPESLEAMSKLDHLSYTSVEELLAEKFRMDRDLLRDLNPGKDPSKKGTTLRVANVAAVKLDVEVARIAVIKSRESVWAFDATDRLIAAYPATIGSDEKPSPTGVHKVTGIAIDPNYTYDPKKLAFEGVQSKEAFEIKPGPNNPVGNVWIGLDEPGYGLHGSPEPEKIRRQRSHGCVRLTNWDARALAEATSPGVEVAFVDDVK